MTEVQNIPTPHGPVIIDGKTYDHVWGPWMPSNRTTKRRQCVLPECHEAERIEARS